MVFICVFLFQLVPFDQDTNIDSCEIYIISLSRQIEKKNAPVVVKFEYYMSESLLSGLESSSLINSKILNQLKRGQNPGFTSRQICDKLRSKLIDWKVYSNTNILNKYIQINMAEPIFINDSEAYLFFEHLNITKRRGVTGGGSILQFFCKEDDQWHIKSTEILEMY